MKNIFLEKIDYEPKLCFDGNFSVVWDSEPVMDNHYLLFPRYEAKSLADSNVDDVYKFIEKTLSQHIAIGDYVLFERGRANFCTSIDGVIHAHAHLFPIANNIGDLFNLPNTLYYEDLMSSLHSIKRENQYLLWGRLNHGFYVAQPIENVEKRIIRNVVSRFVS